SPSRNAAPIAPWESFYRKPSTGSIFITSLGLMKDCSSSRLITMPEIMACQQLLIYPYFNVQFSGYLTIKATWSVVLRLSPSIEIVQRTKFSQLCFCRVNYHLGGWAVPRCFISVLS